MNSKLYFFRNFWALSLLLAIFFTSCTDDDGVDPTPPQTEEGYFIVNEGGFGNANTTLSYYDRQNDTILNNIFQNANNRPLGDQTQSMTVFDERGFIVVQNSAKIEVINRDDFTSLATIGPEEGVTSPRYFVGVSPSKGYVSDWGADGVSGTVKVIDLNSYEVTATILVGQGANHLILHDSDVYVTNNGGYGYDSTVMVIDTQSDSVVDTITVGDNPGSIIVDANGDLWVAGSGRVVYNSDYTINEAESTPGFLARLEDGKVALKLEAEQISAGPADLMVDPAGQNLIFYYAGGIYRINIADASLPASPLIPGNFYGFGIDPVRGEILTGTAPDFSNDGTFSRYSPSGQLIETYTVGIAPNGFAF
uniref:YncE family protein n=1 Tax=Roseihalotalea indica TaxID=2867963 RepID=A0AA49GLT9_9BACT|nr:hypothetical protein K4G66_27470 [Tunicatimonas sp. TK19036]